MGCGPVRTYFQTSFKFLQNTMITSVVRNGSTITGFKTNNTLNHNGHVILSPGSFGTPSILFQSGIGHIDCCKLSRAVQARQTCPFNLIGSTTLSVSGCWSSKYHQLRGVLEGYNVADNPSINLIFQHPSIDSYDNWVRLKLRLPGCSHHSHSRPKIIFGILLDQLMLHRM